MVKLMSCVQCCISLLVLNVFGTFNYGWLLAKVCIQFNTIAHLTVQYTSVHKQLWLCSVMRNIYSSVHASLLHDCQSASYGLVVYTYVWKKTLA